MQNRPHARVLSPFWLRYRSWLRYQLGGAVLALLAAASAPALAQPPDSDANPVTSAVREVLHQQLTAWNQGDLEGFMKHYWNSRDLTFSAQGQTTRGWRETRQRYLDRYPDRAAMGQLAFDRLEITPLGPEAALAIGRWELRQNGQQPQRRGNFSVVFRQLDGRWLIIHDHTSVATAVD
jgi:beta-aspartyl-peptidase (threonine type)